MAESTISDYLPAFFGLFSEDKGHFHNQIARETSGILKPYKAVLKSRAIPRVKTEPVEEANVITDVDDLYCVGNTYLSAKRRIYTMANVGEITSPLAIKIFNFGKKGWHINLSVSSFFDSLHLKEIYKQGSDIFVKNIQLQVDIDEKGRLISKSQGILQVYDLYFAELLTDSSTGLPGFAIKREFSLDSYRNRGIENKFKRVDSSSHKVEEKRRYTFECQKRQIDDSAWSLNWKGTNIQEDDDIVSDDISLIKRTDAYLKKMAGVAGNL